MLVKNGIEIDKFDLELTKWYWVELTPCLVPGLFGVDFLLSGWLCKTGFWRNESSVWTKPTRCVSSTLIVLPHRVL